jgi:hypothetical protein
MRAERRWSSSKVIAGLADVMVMKGVPEHLRSDNGPEFVAKDLRKWLEQLRRFYSEELRIVAGLESPDLVSAFARVPRERYLGAMRELPIRILPGLMVSAKAGF